MNWSATIEMESDDFIAVMHHLRTLASQMKPHGDISFGELCVLSMIESERTESGHQLTPTRLNIMLGTKKPATSRTLAFLEKKEYIEKINDEKDHRICYLKLTEEGKRVLKQERVSFQDMVKRISMRLGENEIIQITRTLEHLSSILEEELMNSAQKC